MTIVRLDDHRQVTPGAEPRPLPASVELEQALIGALMLNNAVLHAVGPRLEPAHFSEEIHRRIWSVATDLIADGVVANPTTLPIYLGDHEVLPGVTVRQYLARLFADAGPPIAAAEYARLIVDLHMRRQLIVAARELEAQAFDPPASLPVERIIDDTEAGLMDIRRRFARTSETFGGAGALAARLIEKVRRVQAGEERRFGVGTGIPDIDRDTGGFQPGLLWIVGGRPGMGKTIVATNFARAAAKPGTGFGALLFSLEVPEQQIIARLLADLAYVAHRPLAFGQILRGDVTEDDLWRLDNARDRLEQMPLGIDYSSRLAVAQIASRVRREKERQAALGVQLGVVIIDYLKFITATDRYQGQRHYEVGEISAGLKQLAKDQNVCVVLLAQLNRALEGRQDRRPTLSDLRESGDLEADADVVCFVYRDAYYIEQSTEFRRQDADTLSRHIDARRELELIVAKNRSGATRSHVLWCDVAHSSIAAQARGAV